VILAIYCPHDECHIALHFELIPAIAAAQPGKIIDA